MTLDEAKRYLHNFWFDKMKFCDCGDPAKVISWVGEILTEKEKIFSDYTEKYDPKKWEKHNQLTDSPGGLLLEYLLDAAELTEHGGSVISSWLTSEGGKLLEAIKLVSNSNEDWY